MSIQPSIHPRNHSPTQTHTHTHTHTHTYIHEGWNFNSGNYSNYLQLIQNRYMFRSFTVLQCSHKGLSPCDFDLIPKIKEPLLGIRFRSVPEILQAVDRSIRTINTTGAAKGILRLPHRRQRVVHNAGDYIEGQ